MPHDMRNTRTPGRMDSGGGHLAPRAACRRQAILSAHQRCTSRSLKPTGGLPWPVGACRHYDEEPCGLPLTSPLATCEMDSKLAILKPGTGAQETHSPTLGRFRCRIWWAKNAVATSRIDGSACLCRPSLSGEACTQDRHPASEYEPFLERGSRRPGRHPAPAGRQRRDRPVASPANAQLSARQRERLRALGRGINTWTTDSSYRRSRP